MDGDDRSGWRNQELFWSQTNKSCKMTNQFCVKYKVPLCFTHHGDCFDLQNSHHAILIYE